MHTLKQPTNKYFVKESAYIDVFISSSMVYWYMLIIQTLSIL